MVMYTNRMYAVTGPLREIIERLEPGVHQFNPIRVLLPKGVEHPVPHYMMVVGRWLSSFRLEESDPDCLRDKRPDFSTLSSFDKKCCAGAAMAQAVIGDAHLWRERHLSGPTFFISDRLKEEIIAAGLRLPPNHEMKSV
ncbi:hypothetical protein R5H32_03780 [Defluviimonas sp. D31]|nr:hypothetical protein [Defluviimonas sp. D31]